MTISPPSSEDAVLRLRQLVQHSADRWKRWLILESLGLAAGVPFWVFQPDHFTNAAARIMLPLADVDPIYQTVLKVEPGDVEGSGDIPIHVRIKGKVPAEIDVLRLADGRRTVEAVAVAPG